MSSTVQFWPGIALILWAYFTRIAIGAPIPVTPEGLGEIGSLGSIAPIAFTFAVEASMDFLDSVLESESGLGLESLENSREDVLDDFDVYINDAERFLAPGEPEPFYLDFDLDCDSDTDAFEDEDYVVIDLDDYVDVDGDEVYGIDEDYVGIGEDIGEDESYFTTDSGEDDLLWLTDEENTVADLNWDKVRTEMLKFNRVNRKRSRRQLMNPYIPPYKIV